MWILALIKNLFFLNFRVFVNRRWSPSALDKYKTFIQSGCGTKNPKMRVFRYNKILIDGVFGNSKFVVPSTLTIDLGFASVNKSVSRRQQTCYSFIPVFYYTEKHASFASILHYIFLILWKFWNFELWKKKFSIFNLEHKWTRLMLCPLRNTFRKTHESSRKPIKTTSLKPGDGITWFNCITLFSAIFQLYSDYQN
jgi:hypothetical protein